VHCCIEECRADRASVTGRILIFASAYRKYRFDMADEKTYSAPAICEQEYEQLQTALEVAETEIQILAQENHQLQTERSQALRENAHLRHLLAQSHARLLEAQAAASKSVPRPINGLEGELSIVNEELQTSLEELQVTAEELEEANAALLQTNETLEQQVAERIAHLEQALAERDELLRCKDHLLYEIGHRVRDSLQTVMSLIRIQTSRSSDPLVRQALQATGARIHAVAQVHDRLFTGGGSGYVRMDRYLGGDLSTDRRCPWRSGTASNP
jgi:two-component system, sensor histidine kinase PdtaS